MEGVAQMKLALRATLLVSLILLVAWPAVSQEKQSLNTDILRDQIRKLESINIEGKSTSIQAIHRRALLNAYKQFQSALQQEIEDLRNIQGAVGSANTETQQEIASQLRKLGQENMEASLKIQDLTSSQQTVASSEASRRGPAGPILTTATESSDEARMVQPRGAVVSETARPRPGDVANPFPASEPPKATSSPGNVNTQAGTGSPGQASTSLNATLNAALRAKIQQRETTKQAETPSTSSNSTSLVDTSSAGDLVNVGLSLAGLKGGTNDPSKNSNSVSVTTSAYALYAASQGVDPLNPGFYNRNSGWRRLSLTLGYDDEKLKTGATQRAQIFGFKYLIMDKRDPARKRNVHYFDLVSTNLQKRAVAFGNLYEKLSYNLSTNNTVKTKIIIPQFRAFLSDRLKTASEDPSKAEEVARIKELLSKIEKGDALFILDSSGLPPNRGEANAWTKEELQFYSNIFRTNYLGPDYRNKLKAEVGQGVLDYIDSFIDRQLSDTKTYDQLAESDEVRDAIERIRRAPQFSFYFLTKQRPEGDDEYTGETIFDYGVANRINLTLNGNYVYRNSKIIGGDSRGAKFSGQFRFQMTPEKLTGRNPLFLSVSADAEALSGRKPTFHAQAKLTIPILNGLDLPFSVTYANRTGLIKENKIKGQFGFSIDTSRLLQALTLK
jgi:hypothetical protein